MSILICCDSSDLQDLLTTAEFPVVLEELELIAEAEEEEEEEDDDETDDEEDGSSHNFSAQSKPENISSASMSLCAPRCLVPTVFLVEMMADLCFVFFPDASLATEEPPFSFRPLFDAFDALTARVVIFTSAAVDRTDANLPSPPSPPSSLPPPPTESLSRREGRRVGNRSGGRHSVPTVFGPNMSARALKPHAPASLAT